MCKLVIIGASGFGREVAWVVARVTCAKPEFELLGFSDDAEGKREGVWCGVPLLGPLEGVAARFGPVAFHCAIGNNRARQAVTARAVAAGLKPVTLIDPSAVVAPDAVVGAGCYVGVGSVVSTGARLGAGALINHQVTVGHDVTVGDFAQLCPGVRVSGGCRVGAGALLGSNSCTLPGVAMGEWSTLGAGGVLLSDLEAGGSRVRIR